MTSSRIFVGLALSVAVVLSTGCTDPDEADVGTEPAFERTMNNLPENSVVKYEVEMAALTRTRLIERDARIDTITSSAAGLRFFDYVLHCTQTTAESFKVKGPNGVPYMLPTKRVSPTLGTIAPLGLGAKWLQGKLPDNERQLLMGCLLAHMNTDNRSVEISIVGPHTAIPRTAEDFTIPEAAFCGDWTVPVDNPDAPGKAAMGAFYSRIVLETCPNWAQGRTCARVQGSCPVVSGPADHVFGAKHHCNKPFLGMYPSCAMSPSSTASVAGKLYNNCVTTFLKKIECPG